MLRTASVLVAATVAVPSTLPAVSRSQTFTIVPAVRSVTVTVSALPTLFTMVTLSAATFVDCASAS
ncbi:hypothetical protein D1872_315890 [compost metagenome]